LDIDSKKRTLIFNDVTEIQTVAEQPVCRILAFNETSESENPKPNTVNILSPAGNKLTAESGLTMRESKETTFEVEAAMMLAVTEVLKLWPDPVEIRQFIELVETHAVVREEVKCSRTFILPST
jgi:hypothetical protein